MRAIAIGPEVDLAATAPGRRLRIVLLTFYNYQSHALRIFHALLRQRGHDVHSIFFKNYFTYCEPTEKDCDLVTDLIARLQPDLVGMSVWSTYYQLAARMTRRIKAAANPVVIWGGVHAQIRPRDCVAHADVACTGEGEVVLADLTDRLSTGCDFADLPGGWVRCGAEIRRNAARPLLPSLDVLPAADLSAAGKYYLAYEKWLDVAAWDRGAVSYDIMMARGCPFACTYCIHNFARREFAGLGTYVRRRSVGHVMRELRAVITARPKLRAIAISDDIFAPPRPWLEEFCAAYKREVGLPFVMYSFPGMVDEKKVRLLRDAGLWCTDIGIQSGSERIRRDCFERETANDRIVDTCRILARHGVVRSLDFIGDNPYENDDDRRQTLDLLIKLPKPFYFNFFSLTYFPGVALTARALRDGFIEEADVEDQAQKGYHTWGGLLRQTRPPAELYWDVLYAMAAHGFPRWLIAALMRTSFLRRHVQQFARALRRVQAMARWKTRAVDALAGRPNLLQQYWADTNRGETPATVVIQPQGDGAPLPGAAPPSGRPMSPVP